MSGKEPLDVVIVYAFDCTTTSTSSWDKVDKIFWLVQEKLKHFKGSCLGYTYVKSTPNTYTSDMKQVDSAETKATGYKRSSAWGRTKCTKNMASGLSEAHKLISYRGHWNSIILLFCDGLVNKGDFFDGAENFISKVPVHTFTLSGDAYDHVLRAIARNSPGGTFSPLPVQDNPTLSGPFSQVLDSILNGTKHSSNNSGRWPLDVVFVYAFDCTTTSPAEKKVDEIFWLVHAKLMECVDSCLGYIFFRSTPNTYTSDMKQVDSTDTDVTGYKPSSAMSSAVCTKKMACGLPEAHKLIRDHGHLNGIILLFSDGLSNRGDFFDGAEDFISKVPVYTFTLGGDANNHVLRSIAKNSPGGTFSPLPVLSNLTPSAPFSQVLNSILKGTNYHSNNSGRWPLDVVFVYAFDCTTTSPADKKADEIFWLVHAKLKESIDSCLGYIFFRSTPNTYTSDMKQVDSTDTNVTGYKSSSAMKTATCTKKMAFGLPEAHKLIRDRGHFNGIILLFSDGLSNRGDFFDGAEDFISKVPVYTFTLGGDADNHVLRTIAQNSPGGKFSPLPVPDNLTLSVPFSQVLDSILNGTKHPSIDSGRWPLDVVFVYAFDCTTTSPADKKVDDIFWSVHAKLKDSMDSSLGYIGFKSNSNTYLSDMKQVDSTDTNVTGYKSSSAMRTAICTKKMASGLPEAHKLIREHGHLNGIILLFSDGLSNKGDFFDGAEDFISKVPVYTFTLGGDADNHVLRAMAANSPGGKFNPILIPDKPLLSVPFSRMLDSILNGTTNEIIDDFNTKDPRPLIGEMRSKPHHLPLQHLKDITNNFSKERILGRGGFGVVYKGILPDGETVAVKKLLQAMPSSEQQFENEVNLLMKLEHPNVVRLIGYCYETKRLHTPHEGKSVFAWNTESLLCLECLPNGSLDKYISDASFGLDWHTRWKIIDGISNGLQYLHEQTNEPIIHLDLKPANILLDGNMQPKITDFGMSRLFNQNQTIHTATVSGTLGYMPPEFQRGIITPMSDIFSLGVIILEVITGHREYPYDIINSSKGFTELELRKWRNRLLKEPGYISLETDCQQIERCIQIGLICVNPERAKRPTVKKVISMLLG